MNIPNRERKQIEALIVKRQAANLEKAIEMCRSHGSSVVELSHAIRLYLDVKRHLKVARGLIVKYGLVDDSKIGTWDFMQKDGSLAAMRRRARKIGISLDQSIMMAALIPSGELDNYAYDIISAAGDAFQAAGVDDSVQWYKYQNKLGSQKAVLAELDRVIAML